MVYLLIGLIVGFLIAAVTMVIAWSVFGFLATWLVSGTVVSLFCWFVDGHKR